MERDSNNMPSQAPQPAGIVTTATEVLMMGKDLVYLRKDMEKALGTLDRMEAAIDKRIEQAEAKFVSREEFEPVKKIVYGLVTLALTGIVMAVLALVLR